MQFIAKSFEELTKKELYEILKVRSQIFIVENNMRCLDMDGVDYDCLHLFLKENENIVAYLRAYKTDGGVKIGRVLTVTHGVGLGRQLMEQAIPVIERHFACSKIILNSQSTAIGFYEKLGFKITSGEFLEENVAHFSMEYQN